MLDPAMLPDLPWTHDALCAEARYNPADWFSSNNRDRIAAKAVCQQCAVQGACLAYAISEDIRHGIWGGATPTERKPNCRGRKARTLAAVINLSR
jgi:WhiB family redox-sensing transcriptional regulator